MPADNLAYVRARRILEITKPVDGDGNKIEHYSLEEDIENRVRCVMAIVASGSPLSIADNTFMVEYVQGLDRKHKTPAREQRLDVLRALDVVLNDELGRIIDDCYMKYDRCFVASNSDFFTSKVLGASFGVIMINMVAKKYQFNNKRWLFVSDETLAKIPNDILTCRKGVVGILECCIKFEQFEGCHTSKNIGDWLHKAHNEAGVQLKYRSHHSVDGSSNAVGSSQLLSQMSQLVCATKISASTCNPHQVDRAVQCSTGNGGFKTCANTGLGKVTKKNH